MKLFMNVFAENTGGAGKATAGKGKGKKGASRATTGRRNKPVPGTPTPRVSIRAPRGRSIQTVQRGLRRAANGTRTQA